MVILINPKNGSFHNCDLHTITKFPDRLAVIKHLLWVRTACDESIGQSIYNSWLKLDVRLLHIRQILKHGALVIYKIASLFGVVVKNVLAIHSWGGALADF